MNRRSLILSAVAAIALSGAVLTTAPSVVMAGDADGFVAHDPYLRSSTPSSKSGAAFLELTNNSGQDDRLVGARSPLEGMIELHTHEQDANGVMRMREIEGGVVIPAGETHKFMRGGDHLMFMGMTAPLDQGQEIAVTLIFEKAGEVEIIVPVDQDRKPDHGSMSN